MHCICDVIQEMGPLCDTVKYWLWSRISLKLWQLQASNLVWVFFNHSSIGTKISYHPHFLCGCGDQSRYVYTCTHNIEIERHNNIMQMYIVCVLVVLTHSLTTQHDTARTHTVPTWSGVAICSLSAAVSFLTQEWTTSTHCPGMSSDSITSREPR